MKKTALLALASAVVFGVPMVASAYDNDPGYGQYRPWYGGDDRTWRYEYDNHDYQYRRRAEPIYYRPTQRYFAKGYTVSYRYLPVHWYDFSNGNQNYSSNFRTEAFRIATHDIPAWGARPPRLIVPIRKPPQQTAITMIVPPKNNTPYYGMPALLPGSSLPEVPLMLEPGVPTAPVPNLDPAAPVPAVPAAPAAPAVPAPPAVPAAPQP